MPSLCSLTCARLAILYVPHCFMPQGLCMCSSFSLEGRFPPLQLASLLFSSPSKCSQELKGNYLNISLLPLVLLGCYMHEHILHLILGSPGVSHLSHCGVREFTHPWANVIKHSRYFPRGTRCKDMVLWQKKHWHGKTKLYYISSPNTSSL